MTNRPPSQRRDTSSSKEFKSKSGSATEGREAENDRRGKVSPSLVSRRGCYCASRGSSASLQTPSRPQKPQTGLSRLALIPSPTCDAFAGPKMLSSSSHPPHLSPRDLGGCPQVLTLAQLSLADVFWSARSTRAALKLSSTLTKPLHDRAAAVCWMSSCSTLTRWLLLPWRLKHCVRNVLRALKGSG